MKKRLRGGYYVGFFKKLPIWGKQGLKHPINKKTVGHHADEMQPAEYNMSWFQNKTYEALKELQETAAVTAQLAVTAKDLDFINSIIINVKKFGAEGNNITDDYEAIQSAVDYVHSVGGGEIHFPMGTYRYTQTLSIPENIMLIGRNDVTNSSVLNYVGTGYAIVTSGLHQRNKISDLKVDCNGNSNGIRFGDIGSNLPPGVVPVIFSLNNISVTNVKPGFNGIELVNVSHIDMMSAKTGFGSNNGGTGLKISADIYNSGVFNATNCTFGRVNSNYIGLEIESNINLDSYVFVSCYFGGEKPIRLVGKNYTRSVNFLGCHAEARKLANSSATEIIAIELGGVLGGTWIGGTITTFGEVNSSAFVFTDRAKKFNVLAAEANAVTEAVFKNKGASIIEGCILQEANLTNGATATHYVSIPDNNFKIEARKITMENIRTKYLYSIDGATKEYWGSKPDRTIGHSRGDIIKNTLTSRVKNISHWKCENAGTESATFIAYGTGWGTSAEKPQTLTADDRGYCYKNTETGNTQMWDGKRWLV
ncbi:glycosyl hydrolase family 28-related protein [Peribacillus simplex]|uniref:glycosyl hydrolase family 28-related protein n=1 Tax=Peribacillus simplex TaxID=1478 RepID=UPI003CFEC1E5